MEQTIERRSLRARRLGCVAIALAVIVSSLALENAVVDHTFPELSRFTQDFSAPYLRREMIALGQEPPQVLFFGDSLMWGWGVSDRDTAVALLAAGGCACKNLAITLGSPTNEYAMLRMLRSERVRPKAIVLEVNLGLFNPAVLNYANLREQVYDVTKVYLTRDDLKLFPKPRKSWRRSVDHALSSLWAMYAYHADAREGILLGEPDEEPRTPPFERVFSLAPIDERNVGVRYVERILAIARESDTPVYSFFTPTNHRAFGKKLDDPRLVANASYLEHVLASRGVRVLRLQSQFDGADFFDSIHLNAAGHRKLARLFAERIAQVGLSAGSNLDPIGFHAP